MARKTKVTTAPRRRNGKLAGPSFEGWENMTGEAFGKLLRASVNFYYHEYKPADIIPHFYSWMKNNGYTLEQINTVKKVSIPAMAGVYARVLEDGCPDFNPVYAQYWKELPGTGGTMNPHSDYLHKWAKTFIEKGQGIEEVVEVEEKKKHVPSIQERIHEQSLEMCKEINEWLDEWDVSPSQFNPKGFDFKSHFSKMQTSQAHARKIKSFYQHEIDDFRDLERMPTAGQLKKLDEHEADQWQQLKEGYSHLKKSDIKKKVDAVEGLLAALDFLIESAKVTRKPRKPKPKTADKLVEKLKYCKTDSKYQLASVQPTDIVGASELWVFNIKSRKLGKYVAANIDPKGMDRAGSGLSVKGTTIIGFNEEKSVQKTLRKPEEQLKEFKSAGKVALRKFMDEIKTTDTKLNGRCNPDTVLLKVIR